MLKKSACSNSCKKVVFFKNINFFFRIQFFRKKKKLIAFMNWVHARIKIIISQSHGCAWWEQLTAFAVSHFENIILFDIRVAKESVCKWENKFLPNFSGYFSLIGWFVWKMICVDKIYPCFLTSSAQIYGDHQCLVDFYSHFSISALTVDIQNSNPFSIYHRLLSRADSNISMASMRAIPFASNLVIVSEMACKVALDEERCGDWESTT